MIKVAICDDDADECVRIEDFVRAYSDFEICAYADSQKLGRDVEGGKSFDLYLLDVVMPKPDGIELARLIRETDETAVVIFLTSHDGRALDAFRVRAAQYLPKPVSYETLSRELDVALKTAQTQKSRTFMLKTKTGTKAIPFHKIVYCALESRCLTCVTSDGEKHVGNTLRTAFDEAAAPLLEDGRFIRPHTSFIANMDFVRGINGNLLSMKTGAPVPIAQSMRAEIRDRYTGYFFGGERE